MNDWDRAIEEANKPEEPAAEEPVEEQVAESEEALDAMEDELDNEEYDDDDDHDLLDDEYDFDDDDYDYRDYRDTPEPIKDDENVSEEHQKIFDAAKDARKVFDDADRALRDAESKVSEIRERSERDFGPDDVFRSMHKVCFEFKTTEYIYTVERYFLFSQINPFF